MQKGRDREEKEGKRQMGECKNTSAKKECEKSRIAKAQNLKPKNKHKSASTKSSARERGSASAESKKSTCPALLITSHKDQ
jgi:hypothetical protein